jgi:hypothetical protein
LNTRASCDYWKLPKCQKSTWMNSKVSANFGRVWLNASICRVCDISRRIFNTNNLWINLQAIKRVVEDKSLHMEIIVNNKVRLFVERDRALPFDQFRRQKKVSMSFNWKQPVVQLFKVSKALKVITLWTWFKLRSICSLWQASMSHVVAFFRLKQPRIFCLSCRIYSHSTVEIWSWILNVRFPRFRWLNSAQVSTK